MASRPACRRAQLDISRTYVTLDRRPTPLKITIRLGFRGIVDNGQRIEITRVGLPGDFSIAKQIRDDLAFEIAAQHASKKVHDVLGAKAQRAVAEQFWIEFALSGHPVMRTPPKDVLHLQGDLPAGLLC